VCDAKSFLARHPLISILGAGEQISPAESRNMVELAVNVINAFARCLPDAGDSHFLVDRIPALIAALANRRVDLSR
jgi:hypothetical protein